MMVVCMEAIRHVDEHGARVTGGCGGQHNMFVTVVVTTQIQYFVYVHKFLTILITSMKNEIQ